MITSPQSIFGQAASVAVAVVVLTLASRVAIPMYPVPITLQSLFVLLAGGILGPRLGSAAIVCWLCLAMIGLPLLADGEGGLKPFLGPTAGYLAAFAPMAWIVGRAMMRGKGNTVAALFTAGVAAHALCLGVGVIWLSRFLPLGEALVQGVYPFIPGALIKSAAAACLLAVLRQYR